MLGSRIAKIAYVVILFLQLSVTTGLQARWGEKSEASIESTNHKVTYFVNADGTYTKIVEEEIKILNERGRSQHAVITFTFDKSREVFKVLEAKTTLNNQEYVLSESNIETKALAVISQ